MTFQSKKKQTKSKSNLGPYENTKSFDNSIMHKYGTGLTVFVYTEPHVLYMKGILSNFLYLSNIMYFENMYMYLCFVLYS